MEKIYVLFMLEIIKTSHFDAWLQNLRDKQGAARIKARILRLSLGNPGDVKPVGGGISEMRITSGPGYRVYFIRRGKIIIVLLCGGDKSTQATDIEKARQLAAAWDEEEKS